MLILLTNLLHGLVGLVWVTGLRRAARPIQAPLWADLLAVALALPPLAGLLRLIASAPDTLGFSLLRVDLWAQSIAGLSPSLLGVIGALLGGTALLFVLQELPPVIRARQRQGLAQRRRDARLEASLARVMAAYHASHQWLGKVRPPLVSLLETQEPVAALDGLFKPEILVSRGLLDLLDDQELDATLAHELAHVVRGGNWWLSLLWVLRATQAANPAALVLWRNYLEAQEEACDALAAFVTGRPAALAAALLKVHGDGNADLSAAQGALGRARVEVLRRADNVTTRRRVRILLDEPLSGRTTWPVRLLVTFTLGAVLWTLG
jgi:Zn-dependent protease with chaperone function